MTVSDNTKQAETIGEFFKSVGAKELNVSEKLVNKLLKIQHEL